LRVSSSVSPVWFSKLGMSIPASGSVHSTIGISPGAMPPSALRVRNAGSRVFETAQVEGLFRYCSRVVETANCPYHIGDGCRFQHPAHRAPDAAQRGACGRSGDVRVDLAALVARGWDPGRRVFAPAADDPLFGYHLCERVRCPRAGDSDRARALGLCEPCTRSFLRSAQLAATGGPQTLAQFKATGLRRYVQAETEQTLCLVCRTPGHERIATNRGLCRECNRLRHARGQSIAELVAGDQRFAPARPRRSFGRCLVDGCGRWAWTGERLCKCCRMRQRKIPAVERPTLDAAVHEQIAEAVKAKGPGEIAQLMAGPETWTVAGRG